jgi:antirestriction protein ArdC
MRNLRSNPTQRRDHYQELTDKIVAALEAGIAPWRRPWDPNACGASTTPVNVATGHRYRGVNLFVLGMSPHAFTSGDPRWCSYRQAAARGWQVRKGEKATPVYFYKPIEIEDKTADRGRETRCIPMLRTFSVFHASQIDGVPALTPPTATKTVPERVKDVELIIQASGVPVQIGGNRAFYSPALDVIQVPLDEAFHGPEQRAVVVLHELAHASGHSTRLNRDLSGGFGSVLYAKEELRAELASVAVGSMIGLPCDIPITQATCSPGSRCSNRIVVRFFTLRPKRKRWPTTSSASIPTTPRRLANPQTLRTRARHRLPRHSQLETREAMHAKSYASAIPDCRRAPITGRDKSKGKSA